MDKCETRSWWAVSKNYDVINNNLKRWNQFSLDDFGLSTPYTSFLTSIIFLIFSFGVGLFNIAIAVNELTAEILKQESQCKRRCGAIKNTENLASFNLNIAVTYATTTSTLFWCSQLLNLLFHLLHRRVRWNV